MSTIQISLNDDVNVAFERLCAEIHRDKTEMVRDLVHQFVATRNARSRLKASSLAAIYEELAAEDVALAEMGMNDYSRLLDEADKA